MPPTAGLRRHFLGWDDAWLPRAAEWLGRDWAGPGPLDLSGVLVIVPTRQTGRRIREALAMFAAGRGGAVFPPRLHTPDALLAEGATAPDVATQLEALLAWVEVLQSIDLEEFPDVFPVPPPRRDFSWAWSLAGNFHRLQSQLTEGGLGFADVLPLSGEAFPETRRWEQLSELESRQTHVLRGRGLREPHAARRAFARVPPVPADIRGLVMVGVPDPLPLAVTALGAWSKVLPLDILVFAPGDEASSFDEWGRPKVDIWEHRPIVLPDFEQRVRPCPTAMAEAERAAAIARGYEEPDGLVAFGVADPAVLPLLESELSRLAIETFNPEGVTYREEGFYVLLAALAALRREPTFEAVAALARCPDFLEALRMRFGPDFSAAGFLAELDELWSDHLPGDLRTATTLLEPAAHDLARGLHLMVEIREALGRGDLVESANAALTLIFGGRTFDRAIPSEARSVAAAAAWREVIAECFTARVQVPRFDATDAWGLALVLFGARRRAEAKPVGALDLQGWLELPWEDAPHLVLAGCNEGAVPESVVGDAFLPESLRERLGLKTNAARFARDAYMLVGIAAVRARHGRLDVLFAKESPNGDVLRPSRLLLQCVPGELPARVSLLFRPARAARPNIPWRRAWRLAPRRLPPPKRVAVTGLKRWLECPFRFYLSQVLRMEAVDLEKAELDALDFGTLCHAVLEALGREARLRDCTDEGELREFMLRELDRVALQRYGPNPTLPLVVQLESARQRLGRVAQLQAREREAGWVIDRIEWPFTLDVDGLEIRGRIDRIDRHVESGAWRVLDYKTTDAAPTPQATHLRTLRAADGEVPPWRRLETTGRPLVWTDLQLPVYLRALAGEIPPGAAVSGGYVNLPKAASGTAVALWAELEGDLRRAADGCVEGVVAAIRAGRFWPPAELPSDRDPFAALFHHGAAASIAWEESS